MAICPACGGEFVAKRGRHRLKYCCMFCRCRAVNYKSYHGTLDGLKHRAAVGTAAYLDRHDHHRARAARLAARDAEYAKLGVAVTVVERGGVVTENRGTVPIAPLITHKVRN